MSGPTTAAGHGEDFKLSLKKWVSWVGYNHIAVTSIAVAGMLLVLMWGIET